MKRLLTIIAVLTIVALPALAHALASLCAISGVVLNADNTPCANCQVTFTPNPPQGTQVINGTSVYPKPVFSTTDSNGNLSPISVYQGTAMTLTITDSNGNISAQQPVSIPATNGATMAQIQSLSFLQPSGIQNVNGLFVGTVTVTASNSPYSTVANDFFIACDATAGNVIVILPPSTASGRWMGITKVDPTTHTCTVAANTAPDAISGMSSYVLTTQFASVQVNDVQAHQWYAVAGLGSVYNAQFNFGSGSVSGNFSIGGTLFANNITAQTTEPSFTPALTGYQAAGTFDPIGYGALMDGEICEDLTLTNGSPIVTSALCANFTGRAGESISVYNPATGLRILNTTILSVQSASSITLATPYTGTTLNGTGGAVWGNDDSIATNAFINAQPINSTFTIQLPPKKMMVVSTPINFNGRNVRFLGSGALAGGGTGLSGTSLVGTATAQSGSLVVPIFTTLPTPATVFYVQSTYGAEIGNLSIAGDNLYGNQLDLIQSKRNPTLVNAIYPQSFPNFHDIYFGSLPGVDFADGAAPYFLHGVNLLNQGAQNDRGRGTDLVFDHGIYGVSLCPDSPHPGACQAVEWHFGLYCNRMSVCFDQSHGGSLTTIDKMEELSSGLLFNIGDTARVEVHNLATENDGTRITWAAPWKASLQVPRNWSVEGSDGSLHTVTTAGTTGATEPVWSTNCPGIGSVCADGTAAWTTLGALPNMFAVALGTGGNPAGSLNVTDSEFDVNGWASPYGTPANAFISSDGGTFDQHFDNMKWLVNGGGNSPAGLNPVDDLSTSGVNAQSLICNPCYGMGESTANGNNIGIVTHTTFSDPRSITRIEITRPAGYPNQAPAGDMGESDINVLVNGAAPDPWRHDFPGEINGSGTLVVNSISGPGAVFGFHCATTGSGFTYRYVATAVSEAGESLAGAEGVVTCGAAVSATNPITGNVFPVNGADHYKLYRTAVGGTSGTELLAVTIPANAFVAGMTAANGFTDTVVDGSLGAAPPTQNTTGMANIGGPTTVFSSLIAKGFGCGPGYYIGTGASAIPTCGGTYDGTLACVSDMSSCNSGTSYVASGGTSKCMVECPAAGGGTWKAVGITVF